MNSTNLKITTELSNCRVYRVGGCPYFDFYNADCMEIMKQYPDNHFDLAIVDPPYGIERFKKPSGTTRFKSSKLMQNIGLTWDNKPTLDYWNELFRISKNQIVWGANNFIMPASEYFLVWNKKQTVDNFASAEYAWVSMGLKTPAKVYDYGIHKHNTITKIHPTEKPVDLYQFILKNYAKCKQCNGELRVVDDDATGETIPCETCNGTFKILDTHLGSASIAIAVHKANVLDKMNLHLTGIEIDVDYFQLAMNRIKKHVAQGTLPF